jgi:sugar phosphate permease
MPIVGFLTAKVDPRKLLSIGLTGGAITLFMLGSLNLQVGYWDIFWPQFFQGLTMGLIFVPLTTVTMSLIPREEMGNATSLFNLMRNLGGSVGCHDCDDADRNTQAQYTSSERMSARSICTLAHSWNKCAPASSPGEWTSLRRLAPLMPRYPGWSPSKR